MNNLRVFSLLFLASAVGLSPLGAAEIKPATHRENVLKVSMVQLIANPAAYDGRLVRFHGYVNLEFEGNAVYLHRDDYEQAIFENGFSLGDVSACMKLDGTRFKQGYAVVVGRFSSSEHGHMVFGLVRSAKAVAPSG